MIRLYLVRHGETEGNQRGVYYGRSDFLLSELGQQQSALLAETLKPIAFDRVIVSSLQRTQQTAQILRPDAVLESFSEFDELDFGDWEGCHYQELSSQDSERYQRWCDDWIHQPPPNGESFHQLQQRVSQGLTRLLADTDEKTLLLVGHQGSLRLILLQLLNLPNSAFWSFSFHHGAYSLVEVEWGHGTVVQLNSRHN